MERFVTPYQTVIVFPDLSSATYALVIIDREMLAATLNITPIGICAIKVEYTLDQDYLLEILHYATMYTELARYAPGSLIEYVARHEN